MSGKLILVTGGSRSGKSEFAEKLVYSLGKNCAYIATAEVKDEEMQLRVQMHQARRNDKFWINFESPINAHKTIETLGEVDSILFDCLTIYTTNLLYSESDKLSLKERHNEVLSAIEVLLDVARKSGKNVVFVTNELGSGLVPFDPELRDFRDIAGLVNQVVAKQMDEVYLVVCGIAVNIKKLAVELAVGGNVDD